MHTGPRREASAETNPADALISDSQLPETQGTKILFLKPSIRSLVFVPGAPATDTVTRAPGKDTGGDEHTHMIRGYPVRQRSEPGSFPGSAPWPRPSQP